MKQAAPRPAVDRGRPAVDGNACGLGGPACVFALKSNFLHFAFIFTEKLKRTHPPEFGRLLL